MKVQTVLLVVSLVMGALACSLWVWAVAGLLSVPPGWQTVSAVLAFFGWPLLRVAIHFARAEFSLWRQVRKIRRWDGVLPQPRERR